MTSKGGAKQQVTLYYMSQHFGICTPVDKLKAITVSEKLAWSGAVTTQSAFAISKLDLFGGPTKQGGVAGTVYFLPGAGDQILPDNLAQKLGRANGADCPGYRGLASVFMTGPADGQAGFYWTANDPYLPGVWITVERAPVGLTAGYAMIPRPGTATHPYETASTSGLSYNSPTAVSPEGDMLIRSSSGNGAPIEWWSLSTRTLLGTSSGSGGNGGTVTNVDIGNDGTAYFVGLYTVFPSVFSALFTCSPLGAISRVDVDAPWFCGVTRVFDLPGPVRVILTAVPHDHTGYCSAGMQQPDADCGRDFSEHGDGSAWGIFHPTGSSANILLKRLTGAALTVTAVGLVTRSEPGDATFCHVEAFHHWFVISDGKWYTIADDTTGSPGTVTASGSWTAGDTNNLPRKSPDSVSFWSGYAQISLEDGSTLRTVNSLDWVSEDSGGGTTYDPVNNALWTHGQFTSHETIRLLDRGELDANPAHAIYECLTNIDWGMGSPSSLIDVAAFEAAGLALFDDNFGLSMIWTRQSTIQDFVQEVLDHIQAVLFVDPQTGLLTLKLIRGDYDVGTLPEISPSTANLSNFGRKLWGDIVNEINVTWTNPTNEQDETVTAHDLASITTQGGIVSDSRNYYGVRYSDLAMRLAARDLRSAGAPLASCDAEVDRSYWQLRPASVLLVNWPEYGLADVVMRVTSIDYGKPGDPTIKLSLIEDVFGLDAADYVSPPTTLWDEPAAVPTPVDQSAVLTLPYFFAANGITDIAGAAYPEVLAGVLAATSNVDTYGYELWGEVTLTDGTTEWDSLASLNLVGYGLLSADLVAEATSTGVAFSSYVGTVLPHQAGFAIFGADTEETSEIALITSAATTFELSRGTLDTVPKAWAAGSPVWFVTTDALIEDPTPRSVAEVVDYRLRTRTSKGLLSLFAAPIITETLTDRPWRPSRPANVTIGGVQFNTLATPVNMIGASSVPVSWSERDRTTEDSVVLAWTAATVPPETGQTTTITVYATDGTTVLATHSGLTGTSFSIPSGSFAAHSIAIVEVASSRTDADGTFVSLQAQRIYVQLAAVAPGADGASGTASVAFTGGAVSGHSLAAPGSSSTTFASSNVIPASLSSSGAASTSIVSAPALPSFLRSSGTTVGSGTTVTVSFPAGSAAGDRVMIHLSGAFAATTPSGWFCMVQSQGSNINGAIISKILTSGDISTGSVAITFAGTGSILAEWIVFVGAPIVHGTSVARDIANGSTLASWSAGATGDVVFWQAGTVSSTAAPTIDRGSDLQVTTGAPWGRVTFETLTGSGSVTGTFSCGGLGAGSLTAGSAAVAPATTSSLAVRGTRITAFSGSSVVYTFPAGSAAGDECIICAGHAFSVTTPAGWTSLDNQTGTNVNGGIFHKTLTSGDISTGTVTISFGGSFNGNIQGITFVGAPSSIRTTTATRNSSTSNPGVTVTTGASPVAGDIAIFFGSCRAPTTQSFPTVNRGSTLENNNDATFPGVVATEVLTASGAVSAAIGYSNSRSASSTSGAYTGIVVITP